jgi:pimeloyl-ACP methyl ester carboxylesterase
VFLSSIRRGAEMPLASVNGVNLYYEETGDGFPLVFSHEFAGDYRAWEPQVRFFAPHYRVIAYNHRGYPPSSVPNDAESYTNEQLVEDLHKLFAFLGIRRAHLAGLAMGATVALNFAIAFPEMVASLTSGGSGAGSINREDFLRRTDMLADILEQKGMDGYISNIEGLPARLILRHKSPHKWETFLRNLRELSPIACAHLLRGVLARRKTIFELEANLKALKVPTLIMVGDQDVPSLEPSIFMHRHIPFSGLAVFPMSGHTLNTEEPDLVNSVMSAFLTAIDNGRWTGLLNPATLRGGLGSTSGAMKS